MSGVLWPPGGAGARCEFCGAAVTDPEVGWVEHKRVGRFYVCGRHRADVVVLWVEFPSPGELLLVTRDGRRRLWPSVGGDRPAGWAARPSRGHPWVVGEPRVVGCDPDGDEPEP